MPPRPLVVLPWLLFLLLAAGCPLNPQTSPANDNQNDNTAADPAGNPSGDGQLAGCSTPATADSWSAEVLRLVNQARRGAGSGELRWNDTLAAQAEQYACELIHDDFFDHRNPVTGSTLADRNADFGYEFWWIGENLAAGQQTPAEAVTAWLNSPCHRKNLLHPAFTELGIGVRTGGDYGIYWVQEFGRPLDAGRYDGPDFSVPGCTE